MKKLFLANGKPTLAEVPKPSLKPGFVLVENHYSFISKGTELQTLKNSADFFYNKLIKQAASTLGSMWKVVKSHGISSAGFAAKSAFTKKLDIGYATSGRVVASESSDYKEGDLVACYGFGYAAHQELSLVPQNLLAKVSDQNMLVQSCSAGVVAIAIHAMRRANLSFGEKVVVIGLGVLGLISCKLAKLSGLDIFAVDIDSSKKDLAIKEGCSDFFTTSDLAENIVARLGHVGADAVIVCAASKDKKLLNFSASLCRKKGKVVIVGDVELNCDREMIYAKEIDLLISCSTGPGRYEQTYEERGFDYPISYVRWTEQRNLQLAADLICKKVLNVDELVLNKFNIDQAQEAYESLSKQSLLSAIFDYQQIDEFAKKVEGSEQLSAEPNFIIPSKSLDLSALEQMSNALERTSLNLCLIGGGGFAKSTLMPVCSQIKSIKNYAVVDQNLSNGLAMSELFDFHRFETSFDHFLTDNKVDWFLVATPHSSHAKICEKILQAKKAVFCEKPMAINMEELDSLIATYNKEQVPFLIDFNRSFSPIIQKILPIVLARHFPMIINYRVNSATPSSWVLDQEQGGQIIGEACHFIELFLTLTNKDVVDISFQNLSRDSGYLGDNFVAIFKFEDGSIANLIYNSCGNDHFGKERIEIAFDKKSFVIQDFKTLHSYPDQTEMAFFSPNKGHFEILKFFTSSLLAHDHAGINNILARQIKASRLAIVLNQLKKQELKTSFLMQEQQ